MSQARSKYLFFLAHDGHYLLIELITRDFYSKYAMELIIIKMLIDSYFAQSLTKESRLDIQKYFQRRQNNLDELIVKIDRSKYDIMRDTRTSKYIQNLVGNDN